jgi:ubiquinone/menaquinone biosynthesis C-methylase UbiE
VTEREQLQEQYRTNANLRARIDLHQRFSTSPLSYPRWVFDGYAFGEEADVLEVGCGDRNIWRENLGRLPAGWRLTLTDFSPGMVEAARAALGDSAEYAVADVQELPFADASFDGVIANHMLFHVENLPRALGEVARVLRSGGLFCATTLGLGHLRALRELVPPREGSPWERARERFMVESVREELAPFFVHRRARAVRGLARGDRARAAARLRAVPRRRGGTRARTAPPCGGIRDRGARLVPHCEGDFTCARPQALTRLC